MSISLVVHHQVLHELVPQLPDGRLSWINETFAGNHSVQYREGFIHPDLMRDIENIHKMWMRAALYEPFKPSRAPQRIYVAKFVPVRADLLPSQTLMIYTHKGTGREQPVEVLMREDLIRKEMVDDLNEWVNALHTNRDEFWWAVPHVV